MLTLGFCGLRWGEAAALKARDLDFGRGVLHVGGNLVYVGARWVEGTPKNSEERDVPMPLIVMEALKPMCGEREPDERVFRDLRGGPIMKQSAAKTTGWWYHALVCLAGRRRNGPRRMTCVTPPPRWPCTRARTSRPYRGCWATRTRA